MDLGFETIGNAIVICHDGGPVLATDPWIEGTAYFGSWTLSHEIPAEQREHILASRYLWISHGHPDHLSPLSLQRLREKEILLPDHRGGRIARDLVSQGFRVRTLRSGKWVQLSERMRIMSIADVFQDALLLIDLGGKLLVNGNDCGDHGVGDFLRATAARYETSFLMCLTGYGDADMINFFDEDGKRVPPPAEHRHPLGPGIAGLLRTYGIGHFAPFSTMHKYQRTDSAWANAHTTPIDAHGKGFDLEGASILPAFVSYDLVHGAATPIDPPRTSDDLHDPSEFGDDWSQELEPGDRDVLASYLSRFSHLKSFLGFVNFRVGGKDNFVDIERERFDRGVTFEVPRNSLMTAVLNDVFDDVLIGNFARTTLHGDWGKEGNAALYPDFCPFVTKYGDNGGAYSPRELRDYFAEYVRRGFFEPDAGALGEDMARSIGTYLG